MPSDTTAYPRGDTGPARRAARIANHRRRLLKLAEELTTIGYQVVPPDDLDAAIAEHLGLTPRAVVRRVPEVPEPDRMMPARYLLGLRIEVFGAWHIVLDVVHTNEPTYNGTVALRLDGTWAQIIVGADDYIPYRIAAENQP